MYLSLKGIINSIYIGTANGRKRTKYLLASICGYKISGGLFPVDNPASNGIFFIKNYGERVLARGGSWWDNSPGWLWDFYMRETRDFLFPDIGFRAAYVSL